MTRNIVLLLLSIAFLSLSGNSALAQNVTIEDLISASKARAAIVKKVQNAVVHIRVEKVIRGHRSMNNPYDLFNDEFFERFFPGVRPPRQSPPEDREFRRDGLGSGSIINQEGYILTNNHVVGDADKIIVKLNDGREMEANIIGTDPQSDIAVIKIEGSELPTLPFGDSDEIQVGESVIAIGNPFGLAQTVTFGIISAKGRSNIGITDYENFIQTDAAINPGNSGGPLINLKGEIIGVNTAIFTRSGGYQGIGFAVPIKMARRIMEDLINKGSVSRGWLGVGIQDISGDLAKAFGLKDTNGSLITSVMSGTPAEASGIQKGDVIVKLQGKLIRDSNQLRNEVAAAKAGSTVEVNLIRKGELKTIRVTLGERPANPIAASQRPEAESLLGITAQELTPELAQQYSLEQETGVVITDIETDSAADKAGLRAGLLITEVDQKVIHSLADFQQTIQEADFEEGILFLVQSNQGSRYIIVKSE